MNQVEQIEALLRRLGMINEIKQNIDEIENAVDVILSLKDEEMNPEEKLEQVFALVEKEKGSIESIKEATDNLRQDLLGKKQPDK